MPDDIIETAIRFTIPAEGDFGEYRDTLFVNPGEWEALTPAQRQKRKRDRRDAWAKSIRDAQKEAAKPLTEPTRRQRRRDARDRVKDLTMQLHQAMEELETLDPEE